MRLDDSTSPRSHSSPSHYVVRAGQHHETVKATDLEVVDGRLVFFDGEEMIAQFMTWDSVRKCDVLPFNSTNDLQVIAADHNRVTFDARFMQENRR